MGNRGKIRVGVIGLDHIHGLVLAVRLWQAGATIAAFHATAPRDVAAMRLLGGGRARSRSIDEIVEDPTIDLIVTAAIPRDRADIAVRALQAGKHVVADKPGVTTLAQLEAVRAAQEASGRRWWVMFGERFENRAVAEACLRARLGDVGEVVSILGLGPHRMGADGRPDWFWDPDATGGILVDIGSHQADQFLSATGAPTADVRWSAVGNASSPRHPAMQDVGQMVLGAGSVLGTHRVDYLSPTGLKTWGDGRLMIVGTDGTLEVRTNVDVAGKKGKEHLIVVDAKGTRRLDPRAGKVDWAKRLVADVVEGSDTFVAQDHVYAVCDVTLRAQAAAGPWPGAAALAGGPA
ncbi:MAG: Gfo/Idh/MocA family oxidoreductase [Acidimicrobiales bacterium]